MVTTEHPLVQALYHVEGKAEIVHGKIVQLPMAGAWPGHAAGEIMVALRDYGKMTRMGRPGSSTLGFLVDLPHRISFSPDVSYWTGPSPGWGFVDHAPDFAVEVRNQEDYGPAAESAMAAKRADYFAAGTLVVWDVNLLGEEVVRAFRDGDAETPATVFRRGEIAHAEPAVPGWTLAVDDLFMPGA